jgi:hypothetical protein
VTNKTALLDQSDDDLHVISLALNHDTMMALTALKSGIDSVLADRGLSSRMTTMSDVVEFCIDQAIEHIELIIGEPDHIADCTLH